MSKISVNSIENLAKTVNVPVGDIAQASNLASSATGKGAALVGFTPNGLLTSTNVQAAIGELVTDLAASTGASLVGYQPAGTGAVARTAQDKMRETVSPEDFGAVGNGVVNDASAVTAALTYALTTGVMFRAKGSSRYLIDNTSISLKNYAPTTVTIDWGGAEVIFQNSGININSAISTSILNTSFSVDPLRGDAKVTLVSTTGIKQGDLIEVNCPALMHGTIKAQHYYIVSELDGNDVYIEGTVCGDINPQQVLDSGQTGSIVVNVYRLAKGICVQNGNFTVIDVNGVATALRIQRHFRAVTDNISVSGHTRNHFAFNYCGYTLSTRIYCRDYGYISKDRGYASLPTDPSGLAFGYGIALARNYSSVVRDCVGGHGWHFADVAVGQMYALFDNVSMSRNGYGLQSHGGVWNAVYKNCEFKGTSGLGCEGVNHLTIEGCRFINTRSHGITNGTNLNVSITNNYFLVDNPGYTSAAVYRASTSTVSAGGLSASDMSSFDFSNNTVIGRTIVNIGPVPVPSRESIVRVSGNLLKFTSVNVHSQKQTFIANNQTENVQQYAFSVFINPGADCISVDGNVVFGQHSTGGGGSLINLAGSQASRISITNNKNTLTYLINATGTLTIHNVSNNIHYGASFLMGGANTVTITNLVYNQYQNYLNYASVITNNVGNVDMS